MSVEHGFKHDLTSKICQSSQPCHRNLLLSCSFAQLKCNRTVVRSNMGKNGITVKLYALKSSHYAQMLKIQYATLCKGFDTHPPLSSHPSLKKFLLENLHNRASYLLQHVIYCKSFKLSLKSIIDPHNLISLRQAFLSVL